MGQSSEIVKVEFYNQTIECVVVGEEPYIVVKRICENLGLDPAMQRRKIKHSPTLNAYAKKINIIDGLMRVQSAMGLHVDALTLWLSGINPRRANTCTRMVLERYQKECVYALNHYFRMGTKRDLAFLHSVIDGSMAKECTGLEKVTPAQWVYIVSDGDAFKVGFSSDVDDRIASLQTGNPREIRLVMKQKTPKASIIEKEIHQRLSDFCIRGEWFSGISKSKIVNMFMSTIEEIM